MSEDREQDEKVRNERSVWGLDDEERLAWDADYNPGPQREIRGCNYMDHPENITAAERDCSEPDSDYYGNGFRLVCNPSQGSVRSRAGGDGGAVQLIEETTEP